MTYSVKPILMLYKDKQGKQGVSIQVIIGTMKAYAATSVKVPESNYKDGVIVGHTDKEGYNTIIKTLCNTIEGKIIAYMKKDITITSKVLKRIANGNHIDTRSPLLTDFISELIKELKSKRSAGRLLHYKVMIDKVRIFDERVRLAEIDYNWIISFEGNLIDSGILRNTLIGNISLLRAIINHALRKEIIFTDPFKKYEPQKKKETIPEYLTANELEAYIMAVQGSIGKRQVAGYYFLLSCFLGYRIGDCMSFSYEKMVVDEQVRLQAKKNDKIVSIPIYDKVRPILDFVRDNPMIEREQKVREHIKDIAEMAGIKKNVKFHTARHTFAMMMMSKSFTVDEVAKMLGDTPQTAAIYARISNIDLSKKILERLN